MTNPQTAEIIRLQNRVSDLQRMNDTQKENLVTRQRQLDDAGGEISKLSVRNARQESRISQLIQEHREFTTELTEKAHAYANEQGWCSEFDDCMEHLGLARRSKDFEVDIDVSFSITVTVTAENEDDAKAMVDQANVDEEAMSFIRHTLSGEHWTIDDVNEA